jgi:hypothetical protein
MRTQATVKETPTPSRGWRGGWPAKVVIVLVSILVVLELLQLAARWLD